MRCKSSAFPIEQGLKLDKGESESRLNSNQFVADPRNNHLEAANRVLVYLKATLSQGILISRAGDPVLSTYYDSVWLGCPYTRRSRTGYMLLLCETPISWKTKKQSLVSRSLAESEYKAIASTVSEIIWVRWLLSELHVHNQLATPLFCDNQAARHIANNPIFHERTKHVKMDFQQKDLLTKGLPTHQLQFLLGNIDITEVHVPS
ncbi:secreted RxLR effector protein 161-like protein [Tanacetum coccineum]